MMEENKPDKAKRFAKKMENFMAEVAEDMLDEEGYSLTKKNIYERIQDIGIPVTAASLKSFYEGFTLGMATSHEDMQLAMLIMVAVRKMIAEKTKGMDEIINKSFPHGNKQ